MKLANDFTTSPVSLPRPQPAIYIDAGQRYLDSSVLTTMPSPTSTESDIETTFNEDPILKDAVGEGELDAKQDKHSDYTATALEITSDTNGDNISTIDEESNGLNLPGEHNDEDDNSRASTTNLFKPEPSKTTTHINSESSSLTKRNIKQYEYIKHGSRIKTLLSTAFRAVADGWLGDEDGERQRKKREAEDDGKKEEEAMSKKARGFKEAEELARDKMEECVILNGVRFLIMPYSNVWISFSFARA